MTTTEPTEGPEAARRNVVRIAAAAIVMVLVAAAVSAAFYLDQRQAYRKEAQDQVLAVGQLKAAELDEWRQARIAEVRVFHGNPDFISMVQRAREAPSQTAYDTVDEWLAGLERNPNYDGVYLIGADGALLSALEGSLRMDEEALASLVTRIGDSDDIDFMDLHRDADSGTIHLTLYAPLRDPDEGSLVGVLALSIDPETYIYPYLQSWPVPSETAETLLVRRDGEDVLFLNDLRFQDDAALNLRIPLDRRELPASRAILGTTGLVEGADYRGMNVLAALYAVPDSPWFLVSKVDSAEAYARVDDRLLLATALGGLLVSFSVGTGLLLWRHQRTRHYRDLYESERSRSWLRDLVDRSLNEVYTFDAETLRITYANAGAHRDLGYRLGELVGLSPADISPDYAAGQLKTAVAPLRQDTDTEIILEVMHRRRDGTEYPAEIHIQCLESDTGPVYLGVAADISERKAVEAELAVHRKHLEELVDARTAELRATNEELDRTNEELQCLNEELASSNEELQATNVELERTLDQLSRANSALEEASVAKSRFLANMSHELRTPLNSIIGFSGIMAQGLAGPLSDEQHAQVEMINTSGKHLLELIDDILDLSKVEAGKVTTHMDHFDAAALVHEVAETVRPLATEKNLELTFGCAEDPCNVYSDEAKVRQILINLAGNAVKFTEEGRIDISVARSGGHVRFAVTDSGPGIPEHEIERIFDTFVQMERTEAEKPKGTGLGLALSREYARLLGGEIETDSVVGEGSTFTLVLPSF